MSMLYFFIFLRTGTTAFLVQYCNYCSIDFFIIIISCCYATFLLFFFLLLFFLLLFFLLLFFLLLLKSILSPSSATFFPHRFGRPVPHLGIHSSPNWNAGGLSHVVSPVVSLA